MSVRAKLPCKSAGVLSYLVAVFPVISENKDARSLRNKIPHASLLFPFGKINIAGKKNIAGMYFLTCPSRSCLRLVGFVIFITQRRSGKYKFIYSVYCIQYENWSFKYAVTFTAMYTSEWNILQNIWLYKIFIINPL